MGNTTFRRTSALPTNVRDLPAHIPIFFSTHPNLSSQDRTAAPSAPTHTPKTRTISRSIGKGTCQLSGLPPNTNATLFWTFTLAPSPPKHSQTCTSLSTDGWSAQKTVTSSMQTAQRRVRPHPPCPHLHVTD
ncbi:hypothetical protein AAFF_G00432260 [Aldrovandia affinis]|uniref:Uncharacterized protein n=1 Tax=Aldrovandia affinis TaxID=143900 RepID=A0AAD7R3B5_9TELE|nr:hypothetical protein AAFF_G00432260 [Aldrovandia affinis]